MPERERFGRKLKALRMKQRTHPLLAHSGRRRGEGVAYVR